MKSIPGVKIIGDTTGGGCGLPFTSELPNGWSIRFSAAPIYNSEGNLTEYGTEPSEGCKIDMTETDKLTGKDTILEFAFLTLDNMLNQ